MVVISKNDAVVDKNTKNFLWGEEENEEREWWLRGQVKGEEENNNADVDALHLHRCRLQLRRCRCRGHSISMSAPTMMWGMMVLILLPLFSYLLSFSPFVAWHAQRVGRRMSDVGMPSIAHPFYPLMHAK